MKVCPIGLRVVRVQRQPIIPRLGYRVPPAEREISALLHEFLLPARSLHSKAQCDLRPGPALSHPLAVLLHRWLAELKISVRQPPRSYTWIRRLNETISDTCSICLLRP